MELNYSKEYYNNVQSILNKIWESQETSIGRAIDAITNCVSKGGLLHVFGCGHTQILVEEAWFRAGQPAFVSPIFDQGLWPHNGPHRASALEKLEGYGRVIFQTHNTKEGEVIIVISNSGRNPVPIDVALAAKEKGLVVIGITSFDYTKNVASKHSTGKRLFEIADIVIDNGGPEGDAIIKIPGLKQKVGPITTIANAFILNSILVQVNANLVTLGREAPVFVSANLDVPDDINEEYLSMYWDRVYTYKG